MGNETLSEALEREHREIDAGIESLTAGLGQATADAGPVRTAMAALRRHIYLEEQFLFPPLRAAGMLGPILVMLKEHGELWRDLDALDQQLDTDAALDDIAASCRELLAKLDRHNAKEEPIVYPQADQTLGAAATAELHDFIASGQLPEGWVCAQA